MIGADLVKKLGALRDGLLVFSSIVYLLGYATWSIYAWRNNLGPVMALDSQYFAAGLPIALGLFCIFGAVFALHYFADVPWRGFVENLSSRWDLRVRLILLICMAAIGIVGLIFIIPVWNFGPPVRVLMIIATITLAYALLSLTAAFSRKPSIFQRFGPSIALVLIWGLGIVYFALNVYPSIPATLGGGRPRFVALDIETSRVSPETISMLQPPGTSVPASGALRTRLLALRMHPGQHYMVEIPTQKGSPPIRLQIERSSVVAVIWE